MTSPAPTSLPRLLLGVGERHMAHLSEHLAVHGALPDMSPQQIATLVEQAGLRGHGGAGFPTAVKLRTVAARRGAKIVVANGTEGEPPSKKDRTLLREAPHLVLDGAALAARATGARETILAICESDERGLRAVNDALRQRREQGFGRREPDFQLVATPDRYLTGQESALVDLLNGGPGRPTFGARPFQRGVRGRPTLVQNVETLAHMALIARHGPRWFRALGTAQHPGSTLVTISGAVGAPGVYEIAHGMPLDDLLTHARPQNPRAFLIGGYFGTWLPAQELLRIRLSADGLRELGAALGAGAIVALPAAACPVAETARVAEWYSAQSAGQCGPCVHGLRAIAFTVAQVARGAAARADIDDLWRWAHELPGRGACQHPDGAARFLASALNVFGQEFADHARHGPCDRCGHPAVLPVPAAPALPLAA